MMTKPLAKSAVSQKRVLDAAARIFRDYGYAGATMRVIAEQAGLKAGSLYYHYTSKDELITVHAEKDHEVVIRNSESVTIGEVFMPPRGAPSREHVIKNGDDSLKVSSGNQDITIGQMQSLDVGTIRKTEVKLLDQLKVGVALTIKSDVVVQVSANAAIQLAVGGTSIMLTPAGVIITAPSTTIVGPVIMAGPVAIGAGTVGVPPIPLV